MSSEGSEQLYAGDLPGTLRGSEVNDGYIAAVCWVRTLDDSLAAETALGTRSEAMQTMIMIGCMIVQRGDQNDLRVRVRVMCALGCTILSSNTNWENGRHRRRG